MCIALIKPATSTEASFITYIKSGEECLTFICDTENPCLKNKLKFADFANDLVATIETIFSMGRRLLHNYVILRQ